MITSEKLPFAVVMGCIVGGWLLMFSWLESDTLRGMMIIMTIYGATRAASSCSCEDEEESQ